MSLPIRWLHVSDFHVGKDDYAVLKMFNYIISHVRKRRSEGFVPDFLFITGDLANKGLESEYETFWLEFVAPLQHEIGQGIEARTYVVPGNHDVDRKKMSAFSREEVAKPESHYLDPTEEGAKLREDLLIPRFKAYLDSDCSVVKGAFNTQEGAYSECITLHGHDVGIVGINTAWLAKDDKDERLLTPGKPLLEKALNNVSSAELRIVLGHHPIDWFIPSHQHPVKSLLGQHNVLYLHGHLHDAWAEPTYGGGQSFLSIQAGAGFQAREGERWRNGLVWGEADLEAKVVKLQPWRWTPVQQAWTPATDAFHESHRVGDWWQYPLPSNHPAKVNYTPSVPLIPVPKGWAIFKTDDLSSHCKMLESDAALRYFDGAVPDWATALSTSIPRRKIVGRIVERFRDAEGASKPIVTLLLAAGCEGKTTALLQAAFIIIEGKNDWRILQRRDEFQPLVAEEILPLLEKKFNWLIILDEADHAAGNLQELLRRLPPLCHGRVHALLACRDTDWLSSHAKNIDWASIDFHKENLRGLDLDDAQAIVNSWGAFGNVGLGDLAEYPAGERANMLGRQSKDEGNTRDGAFFGALLTARSGNDLLKHAHVLLKRLDQRKISTGFSLRDALAYIAVMHAAGLEFLSRPVLAQALKCPLEKLHREVLIPLGQEAAATTTSSFIYTRHRRISEALISVLTEEFGEDIGSMYVVLCQSAIEAIAKGHFVPELGGWRFKVSEHFFEAGKEELAFQIARAMLDIEPSRAQNRTHFANLYRRAGLLENAKNVFREVKVLNDADRGYYLEWAVIEGKDNPASSVFLVGFALSDQYRARQLDNDSAKRALAGLGLSFGLLYEAFHSLQFRDARMAVATLGRALRMDPETKGYLDKHYREALDQGAVPANLEKSLSILHAGISASERAGVDLKIKELLPPLENMTFDGLQELIFNSSYIQR